MASSIVDLIQQDISEIEASSDVYIPIRGYEKSGLAAHYRLPESGKQLDSIAQKVMRETKDQYERNLRIAIDTMIALCDGLYVRPEGVDDYVMLDPEEKGEPLSFNDTSSLGPLIGYTDDSPTVRGLVKRLFRGNDVALISHAEKLGRWMSDTKTDIETEYWQMGEA